MSTRVLEPSPRRTRKQRRLALTTPMFPEGLVSLVLLLLIVGCAGLSVQQAEWARIALSVPLVALLAAVFGSVLAKIRVLDSLAHLASILVGTALSFVLVAMQASDLGQAPRDRVRPLAELVFGWYFGRENADGDKTYLVSILVGIIVWLVGYLAGWTLFRRGWILVSLLLPGFLILVNLGYAPHPDTSFLLAYGLLCVPLAARFHLYVREREWSRHQLVGPRSLPTRFVLLGSIVAIFASTIAWQSPASLSQETFQPIVGELSTRFLEAQDGATEWMRRRTGAQPIDGGNAGSYTSFDGAFSVGGPLSLSDEPQAVVVAEDAPYLVAQRYDSYSGRGWTSTSDETFNNEGPDGRQYSPEMTFRAGQHVPLSSEVTTSREPSKVIVTPLGPTGDRLLTVDTYLTTDRDASVRMSWRQLNDVPYSLANGFNNDLPSDLHSIANLLLSADLSGTEGEGGPGASDAGLQQRISDERLQLISRFLTVRWTADGSGSVDTLYVSGQIPVYDDVDAVFGRSTVESGTPYEVSGSRSSTRRRDLGDAGTDYPEWVQARYLSLPSTVSARTIDLTSQLTAGAVNPAEKARLIEQYLRTTIVYDENVSAPPADADLVDYLLFERQRGYCEYYASAMAVMLRTVGVPSRVVVGFYPGEYDQDQGGHLYRQKNAHAWVEVFFPGYGWIPFEPTASRPLIDEGPPDAADSLSPSSTPQSQDITVAESSTAVPSAGTPDGADPLPPQITPENDVAALGWALPVAIAVVATATLGALCWLLWSVPLRGAPPTSALFLRLRRLGRFLGVGSSVGDTPREFAQAFADAVPASRDHVSRIVKAYELDQFGPDPADQTLVSTATHAWHAIRRQLPAWIIRRRFKRK